ncbi:MAG: GNAT family N-acetyltransferase [Chloroflexi bacterium]|nr:GNAT family N-acetyltransferase [Chloroflexota bacterium]
MTESRIDAAQLLTRAPADALASYFALEHDPRRVQLHVRTNTAGRTLAFVAVCQTGIDLFRPLVVLRSNDAAALHETIRAALQPGRQYLLSAPPSLQPEIAAECELQGVTINTISTLTVADFKPVANILVQTSRTPDGLLRASIAARGGGIAAEAGVSWISTRYAEVYVQVNESLRNRGLGKSVVSALCAAILERGRTPLYVAAADNVASQRLAARLGFAETGAFELTGAMTVR